MKRWNFRRVTVSRFGTTYVRTPTLLTVWRDRVPVISVRRMEVDRVSELETERLIRAWEHAFANGEAA